MTKFLFDLIGAILGAIVHVYLLVGFALIACVALLLAFLVPLVIGMTKIGKIIKGKDV